MTTCSCGLPLYPHCWPRARHYQPCDVLVCDECGQVEQPENPCATTERDELEGSNAV